MSQAMPAVPHSRSPVLEAPPALASDGRSLPARWAVIAAIGAAMAGIAWVLIARPPARGLYRGVYWLHDNVGLPVYAHVWRIEQPFSLIWLLPAAVLVGLGLVGWLTNRSLLRAIQRRLLIHAVNRPILRPLLFASLRWLQARRHGEIFATRVLDHLTERRTQALRSAVARRSGIAHFDLAATLALAVEVARLSSRVSGAPSGQARQTPDVLILSGRAALCVHAHQLGSPNKRDNQGLAQQVGRVAELVADRSFTWPYTVDLIQILRDVLLEPLRSPNERRRSELAERIEALSREVRREARQWSRGVEASLRGYRSEQPGEHPNRPDALLLAAQLVAVSAHTRGRHEDLRTLSDDVLRLETDWRAGAVARGDLSIGPDPAEDLGQALRSTELELLLRPAGGIADAQPVDAQRMSRPVAGLLLVPRTIETAARVDGDAAR